MGHPGLAIDRFGPEQEDLRHDRGLAQSADRGLAPVKSGRSLRRAEACPCRAVDIDVTAKAVARIEKLFANSIWCATADQAILQASSCALEKKAPSSMERTISPTLSLSSSTGR